MNEELLNAASEEIVVTATKEVVTTTVDAIEEEQVDISTTAIDKVVEVAETEIIEVVIEEGTGYVAGQSGLHSTLPDKNDPNQHEIEAITGLRAELNALNTVKTPQTLYSDKLNVANYYEWKDASYDEYGYFVSIAPGTSKIQICNGSDILGVSVNDAGFIGGQSAQIPRDHAYGLIVTSGVVDVRCELDINVGDCVISNARGYAKKSGSNFGYKVFATAEKNGVKYATIALGVQADVTNVLGEDLEIIDARLDAAESNIISAVNVANQAYQKANEIEVSNQGMSNKVNDALTTVDKVVADVDSLNTQVSNSALISAQAKAIAESAATSAESMKNEAIAKADEALAESSELRRGLEVKIAEIDTELDNTALELEATKESIESTKNELQSNIDDILAELDNTKTDVDNMREEITADIEAVDKNLDETKEMLNTTKEELSNSINTNKENIESISQEIEPLATWSNDTQSGTAGFVARANGDSATLASIVTWQGETNESIAGFKQEVADTYATIESVTSLKSETTEAIAGVKQEATETYATIESVTALQTETTEAIAGVKQEASETYATIESVAFLETNTSNAIAGVKQEVSETYATIESVVSLEIETSKSIADFKQEVQDGYATQQMVSAVNDSLSSFKQEVEDDYATQEMVSSVDDALTSYKQEVEDTYATQEMVTYVGDNLTSYKQEVSETYATQQMVSTVDEALTSYKQEVSDNYATQQMVTEVGDNLANFQQEVEDDYATQEMVTTVDNALTTYKQEVEENYATQQMLTTVENNLASFQQEVKKDYATQQMVTTVGNNLASFEQEVGETYATQEMVTTLETNTSKALADYKQEVQDGYATQAMVTKLETDTNNALTDYKQEVSNTYATNTSLANLETETTNAIAASEEKAATTYASKSDLTSFESNTNIAMARIEQKADANGAYIQSTVSNMDKYSVGPHSQIYGFTLEQAASVLEDGMIYVPTESITEKYDYIDADGKAQIYERTFTPQYLYKWGKVNEEYRWITVDKNYTETSETNTSSKAVYFTTTEPVVSGNFGYWYTNGDTINGTTGAYESYTLYKWDYYVDEANTTQCHWVAVATLAGNSQNRAVSQIRQDANSIIAEVIDARGSFASLSAKLSDTDSTVQTTALWAVDSETGENYNLATIKQTANAAGASIAQVVEDVGKDGEVNAASIVAAVNEAGSSVVINADHIRFDGFVSFANQSDVDKVKESAVYDTQVEYALSNSATTFDAVTDWSVGAPTWQSDKYMWQRTVITRGDETIDYSNPTCIQGAKGADGTGVAIKGTAYVKDIVVDDSIINNEYVIYKDAQCTDQIINAEDGDSYLIDGYLFVYSRTDDKFVCTGKIQGPSGETPTISINSDGYWVINGATSSIKAEGETPTVDISDDGYWVINDSKTSVRAIGVDAPTVVSEKKQFYLSTSNTSCVGGSWSDSPSGFQYSTNKYMWSRSVYTMSDNTTVEGNPSLDKTFTTISNWCMTNDETLINGASIATGTIDAQKITADFVSALNLEVGNQVTMGENAVISWGNLPDGVATTQDVDDAKNSVVNEVKGLDYQTSSQVKTEISGSKIRTDQIEVTDLNAFGATIGGWEIGESGIFKDSTQLLTDDTITADSLVTSSQSPIRLALGYNTREETVFEKFQSDAHGGQVFISKECMPPPIAIEVYAVSDQDGGDETNYTWTYNITNTGYEIVGNHNEYAFIGGIDITVEETVVRDNSKFKVLNDGSMYASAANITGKGRIGGWTLDGDVLKSGELGQADSFYMDTQPDGDRTGLFGSRENREYKWMLGVGENFGVTNEGAMYAKKGLIGGWEFGNANHEQCLIGPETKYNDGSTAHVIFYPDRLRAPIAEEYSAGWYEIVEATNTFLGNEYALASTVNALPQIKCGWYKTSKASTDISEFVDFGYEFAGTPYVFVTAMSEGAGVRVTINPDNANNDNGRSIMEHGFYVRVQRNAAYTTELFWLAVYIPGSPNTHNKTGL